MHYGNRDRLYLPSTGRRNRVQLKFQALAPGPIPRL